MYALASEILDAARSAEFANRLRSLSSIELMRDKSGEVEYFTGNSVVVLRVLQSGVAKTMRCYRVENPHLEAIYGKNYFAKEFNIARGGGEGGAEKLIDVVLCDWVEGISLDTTVRRAIAEARRGGRGACDYRDSGNHTLRKLSIAFDTMACGLLRKDWAHGDISPDNIIVREDGSMELIDFDTAFLPALKGRKSLSLGTPQFQSPLRRIEHFDKSIDDFSLMLISLSLRALSEDIWLYEKEPSLDNLLLDGQSVSERDGELLREVTQLMA